MSRNEAQEGAYILLEVIAAITSTVICGWAGLHIPQPQSWLMTVPMLMIMYLMSGRARITRNW